MAVIITLLLAAAASTVAGILFAFAFGKMAEDPVSFSDTDKRFAIGGVACATLLQALCWAAAGYQIGGGL